MSQLQVNVSVHSVWSGGAVRNVFMFLMWWNGAIVFFRVSSRGKQICCLEILQVSRVSNESTLCDCV